MKVGIVTFHTAINYGAILQCFALSRTLKLMNIDVEVVDYRPSYIARQYGIIPPIDKGFAYWIKTLIKNILVIKPKTIRNTKFNNFRTKLPLSQKRFSLSNNFSDDYDLMIFGSDQIWNPLLSNGKDLIFCGGFHHAKSRLIAYGASTNPAILNGDYNEYFRDIITAFDSISVRENSLNNYLNSIKNNVSQIVVDPVLLLDRKEWDKIAISYSKKKYLLIYTVPQSHMVRSHAEIVAKTFGLDIIEITPSVRNVKNNSYLQDVGPEEFVGLFKNASYIVTTSFHGVAFAVKYNKPFSTILLGTAVDDRALNLLRLIGIEDRAISTETNTIYMESIDYNTVNQKLDSLKICSIKFLKSNLTKN